MKKFVSAVISVLLTATALVPAYSTAEDFIMGDANGDGKFTVADVSLFQNWIIGKDVTLNNYQAVDFCEDGVLDIFDLSMMKKELLIHNSSDEYPVKSPIVVDEFTPCTTTIEDAFRFDSSGINIEIKHQYSVPERIWTADDFRGVDNIKSVSQYSNINPTSPYPKKPYRQTVEIMLENRSAENVIKMINDIEALNLPEIKEIEVFRYGLGCEPVTPEDLDKYFQIN
ncbi:MAG: dockerin type I repeat-containing protein [Ruminococcus sp.]|nr:dockerin type I repeat-containing protein [Ruminococcus sp.]